MKIKMFSVTLVLLFFSTLTYAQMWEWARNAGNYNTNLNGWPLVPNDGIAYDNYHNVYSLGSFVDTLRLADTLIVSRNGTTYTNNLFIIKYNESGQRIWIKIFKDCEESDIVQTGNNQLKVDFNGDIIFAGRAMQNLGGQPLNGSYFICKMRDNGNILWISKFQSGAKFTVDNQGAVYAAFINYSSFVNPVFDNIPLNTINSSCIGKLAANGSAVWLKQFPHSAPSSLRTTLEINPSGNELLLTGLYSGTLNIDGLILNGPLWTGFLGRFSTLNGNLIKHIPVTCPSPNNLFLAHGQWVTDSTIVFTGGNQYSGTYVINDSTIIADGDPAYQNIFNACIDTSGRVKWNNVIRGGIGEFGYQTNRSNCIAVRNNNIYICGSVMRNATINSTVMWDEYVSIGFIARYDLNGNYKFFTVGGAHVSIGIISNIVVTPEDKMYMGGHQIQWGGGIPDPPGVFGSINLPALGIEQFFVGKLDANSNILSGKLYIDYDNDGNYSAGDTVVPNALLKLLPSQNFTTTNSEGYYSFGMGTGNYTVAPFANLPLYCTVNPADYSGNSPTLGNALENRDFRLAPIPGINDLEIEMTQLNRARPGFQLRYMVTVRNKGNTTLNGQYAFRFNPALNFDSSEIIPSGIFPDSLVYSYTNFEPSEIIQNILTFTVDPATPNTFSFMSNAYVYPVINDTTPADNVNQLTTPVLGAWDPNNKFVLPYTKIRIDTAQAGLKTIEYSLHFQNTGNDTAINILILDSLSALSDLSTLEVISSSHPVDVQIKGQRTLLFYFRNIYLVDSIQNEPKSHGYIKFRLRPNTTVTLTDTIFNSCGIYFDYNPVVETNTVKTHFYPPGIIPLQLTGFTTTIKGNAVLLEWKTAFEQNISHFDIEWSKDITGFYKKGNVNGRNIQTGSRYEFVDLSPVQGPNFYRLKIVDTDNTYTYSEIRKVNLQGLNSLLIHPNPATKELHFSLDRINIAGNYSISIYDIHGKIILAESRVGFNTNLNANVNIEKLQRGTYVLKVQVMDKIYQAFFEKL